MGPRLLQIRLFPPGSMISLLNNKRGLSLLETIIYIGLFAVILPATVLFFFQFTQSSETYARRAQMEQAASMILSHFNTELSRAESWNITGSVFDSDNSTLSYTNIQGQLVTIDRPTEIVDFDGTPQNVRRLRMTIGANPSQWMTPSTIDVVAFHFEEVQNSLGTTTGLNLRVEFIMLNPDGGPFRAATFVSQTTFVLGPATLPL